MQLEQVKEHFKDAKEVRCLVDNEIYSFDDMDERGIQKLGLRFWFDLKQGGTVLICRTKTNKLAEIISYKDKGMKITEQQVKDLDNGSTTVRQLFPQVFEMELEEGVWYKAGFYMVNIKEMRKDRGKVFGFRNGDWYEANNFKLINGAYPLEKANLEEVKQRMTEELVRLGFVKGCSFKPLNETYPIKKTSGNLDFDHFNKEFNWCIYIDGFTVFENGKFATLIVEPTQKEILQAKIKEIQEEIDKL